MINPYKNSGVDVQKAEEVINSAKPKIQSTYSKHVLNDIGGFGGFFQLPTGYQTPVLVSGSDGVGTKLKVAQELNINNTIGIDLVAMCANDILTSGARPLYFLDYVATGDLNPDQFEQIMEGIVKGCELAQCSLIGGETAEMPGFYKTPGEYDLAGFITGVVEKSKIIDGSKVKRDDTVIGLASSGFHSNGWSLVRARLGSEITPDLLEPTRIYVKPVLDLLSKGFTVNAMAHITGGGLWYNINRSLPSDKYCLKYPGTWPVPDCFTRILPRTDPIAYDIFNMGIGYVLVVPPDLADPVKEHFISHKINAYTIGRIENK